MATSMRLHKRSRFERRSLARQRRVQKRLDQLKRGVPRRRALSTRARAGLFVVSLLLGLGLAPVVTGSLLSWWNDAPVTLQSIAVQGTQRLRAEAVAARIAEARGLDLEALRVEDLENAVVAHPWIRSARVAILPTGKILVEVEEREPRALLWVGAQPKAAAYFVDAEGVAFAPVDAAGEPEAARLPVLVARGPETDTLVRDVLPILDRLDALALPGLARADQPHRGLQLALASDGDERGFVLARSDGRTEVILGSHLDDVLERLERLERLLSSGLGELRMTTSIDLRFAGQAVLRTEGASG